MYDDERPTYYLSDVQDMIREGVLTVEELNEMDPIIIDDGDKR